MINRPTANSTSPSGHVARLPSVHVTVFVTIVVVVVPMIPSPPKRKLRAGVSPQRAAPELSRWPLYSGENSHSHRRISSDPQAFDVAVVFPFYRPRFVESRGTRIQFGLPGLSDRRIAFPKNHIGEYVAVAVRTGDNPLARPRDFRAKSILDGFRCQCLTRLDQQRARGE